MSAVHPQFEPVLAAIRSALALPELPLESDGSCQLVFGDRIAVNVGWRESGAQVIWFSPVGALGPQDREARLALLLRANLFWQETGGATLALSEDGDTVVLCYQAGAGSLEAGDVEALLGWFVDMAEHWMARLEQGAGDGAAAGTHTAPPAGFSRA